MAPPALSTALGLPTPSELKAFARACTKLLDESTARGVGVRSVRARAGAGVQYLGHRPYLPGDETRHIDWRRSGVGRRLVVRQFQLESSTDWQICVDVSSSMHTNAAAKWRQAARIAIACGYLLLEAGHRVGMLLYEDGVVAACPPGRGQTHFLSLLRLIAGHRPRSRRAGSALASCAERLRGMPSALVLSDFLSTERTRSDLHRMLGSCYDLQLIQLRDEGDATQSEHESAELRDVETGQTLVAALDAAALAAARRCLDEVTAALSGLCRSQCIAFSCADARAPWRILLYEHFRRARMR
jgi:uncharacterized protein (DUF58 family)